MNNKITFEATWSKENQKSTPRGLLALEVMKFYKKEVGLWLNRLDERQLEKIELYNLAVTIELDYGKNTSSQRKLMFALYDIEANEMNGGFQGTKESMVSPSDLYEQDLKEYAPRISLFKEKEQYFGHIIDNYRIILEERETEKGIIIKAIEGFTHWNKMFTAGWIERQFIRLAENGCHLKDSKQIRYYWRLFKQYNNDNELLLKHDKLVTKEEYKKSVPICEATGKYLPEGKGHLAHINAVGMGMNRKDEANMNYPSNWLHLSYEAHIKQQHQKGWDWMKKEYPHLRFKIDRALNKEYK